MAGTGRQRVAIVRIQSLRPAGADGRCGAAGLGSCWGALAPWTVPSS